MPNRSIRTVIGGQALISVGPDQTIRDTVRQMTDRNVGAVPVVENGLLVGMFTERDVMSRIVAPGLEPEATTVGSVMTHNPTTVHPDKPLIYALHVMHENGFRHLPVVENGRCIGMVSSRDAQGLELLEFEHDTERREYITEILA